MKSRCVIPRFHDTVARLSRHQAASPKARSRHAERTGQGDRVTADLLLELHARLMAGTRPERYGGKLRDQQNWIGGSDYNP